MVLILVILDDWWIPLPVVFVSGVIIWGATGLITNFINKHWGRTILVINSFFFPIIPPELGRDPALAHLIVVWAAFSWLVSQQSILWHNPSN